MKATTAILLAGGLVLATPGIAPAARAADVFTSQAAPMFMPGIDNKLPGYPGHRLEIYRKQRWFIPSEIGAALERMGFLYKTVVHPVAAHEPGVKYGGRTIYGPARYLKAYVELSGRPEEVFNAYLSNMSPMSLEEKQDYAYPLAGFVFLSRPDLLDKI